MGQVTIYLEDEIEKKMSAAAKSVHLSKSKWVTSLIREKLVNEWPKSIAELAGAWQDMPLVEEDREKLGSDVEREEL